MDLPFNHTIASRKVSHLHEGPAWLLDMGPLWCPLKHIAPIHVPIDWHAKLHPGHPYIDALRGAFEKAVTGKGPCPPPFLAWLPDGYDDEGAMRGNNPPDNRIQMHEGRHRYLAATTLGLSHVPIFLWVRQGDWGTTRPLSTFPTLIKTARGILWKLGE